MQPPPGWEVRRVFLETKFSSYMKKFTQVLSAIVCIGAVMFLAGEWPENTPISHVLLFDGGAIATIALTGLYLKKTYKDER